MKLAEFEAIRAGGEDKLKEALDFERNVLDIAASEFELLTPLEKIDLKRIQDDRNRCAHPSMQSHESPYQPTAELARTHMRNAVEVLLEKEPVQGKAAFTRICDEIKSKYFPTSKEAAIRHLESGPLRRARKVLLRNLILGITRSNLNDSLQADERTRQLAAIGAIVELHRGMAEEIFRTEMPNVFRATDDEKLWLLIRYCRFVQLAWTVMDEATRGRLITYITMATDEDLLKAIGNGIHVAELKDTAVAKLDGLTEDQLARLIASKPMPEYISPAIHHFEYARSWRGAESLGKSLIVPLAEVFCESDIGTLFTAIKDNDQIWDAGGMRDILAEFFDGSSHLHSDARVQAAWQDLLTDLNGKTTWYSDSDLQNKMETSGMWTPAE